MNELNSIKFEKATFAADAFGVSKQLLRAQGVASVIFGYTGGHKEIRRTKKFPPAQPGMEAIRSRMTSANHLRGIIRHFWRNINPTDKGGQFVDRGGQYRSAIFTTPKNSVKSPRHRRKFDPTGPFRAYCDGDYPRFRLLSAEEYHQDYYRKILQYKFYRFNSGRDQFYKIWGKSRIEISPSVPYYFRERTRAAVKRD